MAALMAGAVLSGCSLLPAARDEPRAPAGPVMTPEEGWRAHRYSLQPIDRFLLTGRITSVELVLRADLHWQQDADGQFNLHMAGPFGAGAVDLRGDAQAVEVRSSEGIETTHDPEGWIRSHYGWTLPIAGLRHWALGLPIPRIKSVRQLDDQGRLAQLVQSGWTLTYTEYQQQNGYDLPRRFEAYNGQVRLKLLIDTWDDLPAARQ